MIYVTLGTMYLDFPRLVKKMDSIAAATGEEVVMQTGLARTLPVHCTHFGFKPHETLLEIQSQARLVVGHAGIGVTMDALSTKRPLVLVPRLKQFQEHTNDHQVEIARAVEKRGWGRMVLNVDDIDALCAHPPAAATNYTPDRERLLARVRHFVNRVAEEKFGGGSA